METATVSTKYGTLVCLSNDSIYTDHLAKGEYWDGELIETRLRPYITSARVILDIGGHIGTHAVAYGKINPHAKIYTFEPQSHIYELNVQNTSSNPNITSIHACVGQKCQPTHLLDHSIDGAAALCPLDVPGYKRMNFGGRSIGPGAYECDMITIDSLNLEACDFIKMDIEGAEPLAILGAMETIKKFRPVIFFESNAKKLVDYIREAANVDSSEDIPETRTLLEAIGYKTYVPVYDLWCLNYLTAPQSYPKSTVVPAESLLTIQCYTLPSSEEILARMMRAIEELETFGFASIICIFNSSSADATVWAADHNSWRIGNGTTEAITRKNMMRLADRTGDPAESINGLNLMIDNDQVNWDLLVPSFLRLLTRPFGDVDAIACNHLGVYRDLDLIDPKPDTRSEYAIPRSSERIPVRSAFGGAVLYLNNVLYGREFTRTAEFHSGLKMVIDPDFITAFTPECSGKPINGRFFTE